MTREKLESRLAELQSEFLRAKNLYEQSRANVDALAGAIQDCQYWLQELDTKSEETKKES